MLRLQGGRGEPSDDDSVDSPSEASGDEEADTEECVILGGVKGPGQEQVSTVRGQTEKQKAMQTMLAGINVMGLGATNTKLASLQAMLCRYEDKKQVELPAVAITGHMRKHEGGLAMAPYEAWLSRSMSSRPRRERSRRSRLAGESRGYKQEVREDRPVEKYRRRTMDELDKH